LRRIELICYDQQSKSIEYVLKKYKVPYHVDLVMQDDSKLLRYTVISPDIISNTLASELESIIDTSQKELYITSQHIEATLSNYLTKLVEEEKEMHKESKGKKLAEEFRALIEPSVELSKSLWYMIVIASAVAIFGLFSNNASLVIGAMLLSPLLGPITAFSFNAAVGNPEKMLKAAFSGLILTTTIIATGAGLTAIASSFTDLPITDEILARTQMTPVFLAIAILLGLGGGIAMTSDIPGILVGVAIAAALVPPAAVAGIGLALLDYDIFINALILTIANICGLILGTIMVFFAIGVTPRKYYEKEKARKFITYTITVFVILSVVVGILTFWL